MLATAKASKLMSKMTVPTDEDLRKDSLMKILINNDLEALLRLDIQTIDLNTFQPCEELLFIDDEITPLIYCAYYGKTDLARVLIQNKYIDLDLETARTRQNALIVACLGGNYEMAKLLLDHGAQVNKPNFYHQTPIIAAFNRAILQVGSFQNRCICFRIAQLLVRRGADLNWFIDKQKGHTLLHVLCAANNQMNKVQKTLNYDIIKFLVTKGADVSLRSLDDKKPEDLVVGHCNMIAVLDLLIKKKQPITQGSQITTLISLDDGLFLRRRKKTSYKEMFEDRIESTMANDKESILKQASAKLAQSPLQSDCEDDKPAWAMCFRTNKDKLL